MRSTPTIQKRKERNDMRKTAAIATALLILAASSRSSAGDTFETNIRFNAQRALGSEFSLMVQQGFNLTQRRKYAEADAKLDAAITGFKTIISKGDRKARYLSFRTKEEYDAYKKDETVKVVWLSEGYARAYALKAFIQVNLKNLKKAKELLKKNLAVSPMDAGAYCELGYIANKEKETKKALEYYRKALAAAKRFKSRKSDEPIALRGIGFCLIDLGKLKKAREIYINALKLDPGSKVALSELKYIESIMKNQITN